jgi:hypothetical protein
VLSADLLRNLVVNIPNLEPALVVPLNPFAIYRIVPVHALGQGY